MTSLKTVLAALIVAGSAGLAFASDNGDGTKLLDSVRQTQTHSVAGFVTEGRNSSAPQEFSYGDAAVFRPMGDGAFRQSTPLTAQPVPVQNGPEYRGSAM